MRNEKGQFVGGIPSENRLPIGTIRIRTRHGRGGIRRAHVKVLEPNVWILRAVYVWESCNGHLPEGYGVHHIDGDSLNDSDENLKAVSKAEHLEIHRHEFQGKAIEAFVITRRKLKWSTKSKFGKITGRHPNNCQCPIHC